MSTEASSSQHGGSQLKGKQKSTLFELQVRAFLDAAEDVDVDTDTLEDLLEDLGDEGSENGDEDEQNDAVGVSDTEDVCPLVHEQHHNSGGQDSQAEESDEGLDLDMSELKEYEQESQEAWTKEDVKKIMHHLKERGMSSFVREYVIMQNIPIPKLLYAFGVMLCKELRNKRPKTLLYFLRVAMSREIHLREKLTQYNTISDVVSLITSSRRILVLTGAGISSVHDSRSISPGHSSMFIPGVSCGIPDFRSRDGLFDIQYFKENPAVFYSFASQIYPSNFVPSLCHRFIKLLETRGKLLRNYTQNIDTLETLAGISRVLQCHGSFKTASCLQCRHKVPGTEIEKDILEHRVPYCDVCVAKRKEILGLKTKANKRNGKKQGKGKKNEWDCDTDEDEDDVPVGVMKPDITFFGEKLTDEFDHALVEDRDKVDLLLVIGTSLKVSPVSEIISHLPHSVPQILINKTPIRHINPDIVLLGNADEIVHHLCEQIGWDLPPPPTKIGHPNLEVPPHPKSTKRSSQEIIDRAEPRRVGDSHVWLFEGAEGGKWVHDLAERSAQGKLQASPASLNSSQRLSEGPDLKKLRVE
ncbi:hypothetical protein SERLADRAFT_442077 [Serpula lacrymans var. lacrymans S7.9]|uniref:Deacetylase sirtuin-type domain-containing protein n=1 Tax=Serpula lacrymans var. lacrymans (strain S7.9) TaxID=578457 RepID=F8P8I7_SERL9|nr:uncharacterized protein SERLADRAFT_442077 [Serpula lacrymans var. lacrymans S7.9]EGO20743.1 hypothetical protein SERLADRAFT_442077 [Serpula lacrymans var. lacrymans S7.9]